MLFRFKRHGVTLQDRFIPFCGIGKQISEGSKMYKLYKELGVRIEGVGVEREYRIVCSGQQ